jgi:Holliday junction DNA helicase RuvA
MISQLRGKLISKLPTEIVVECAGVGYNAFVSLTTSDNLPEPGENVLVYTLLIPREDSLNLYAFWNELEREAFKLLISISGIGPKMSLGILSSVSIEALQEYIITGNLVALSKLPGVGKKTAERLIVELKDKILKLGTTIQTIPSEINFIKQEAISALVTLGYSFVVAEKAVRYVLSEENIASISAEKLIKQALKFAMK